MIKGRSGTVWIDEAQSIDELVLSRIGELPPSPYKWDMLATSWGVVLCNQEHPPMIIIDGKLETLEVKKP